MPKDKIIGDQSSSSVSRSLPEQMMTQRRLEGPRLSSSAGFTLIELLTVVAIIGVLAMMVIPTYDAFVTRAKNARAKSEVRLLETEINSWSFETGSLPTDLATIHRDTLLDPWGHGYVYNNFSNLGVDPARSRFGIDLNTDFDICSMGKDGLTTAVVSDATARDDVIRGANGAFLDFGEEW